MHSILGTLCTCRVLAYPLMSFPTLVKVIFTVEVVGGYLMPETRCLFPGAQGVLASVSASVFTFGRLAVVTVWVLWHVISQM